MKIVSSLVLSGLITLSGCQTLADSADVPARITDPNAASRAALQNAVNDALQTEVLLAADALTSSSILVIARKPPRSLQSQPATGRDMDPPIRLQLVVTDSDCILIDTRDETRRLLENTTCVAE